MTLYEIMKLKQEGFDIADTEWDWGTYVGFIDEDQVEDAYDRFILYFIQNVEIERLNEDWYSPCKVAEFVVKHLNAFKKFFNEENREGYRPMDYEDADNSNEDEGFFEAYMCGIESLLCGNYCEDDYEKLYKLLTK